MTPKMTPRELYLEMQLKNYDLTKLFLIYNGEKKFFCYLPYPDKMSDYTYKSDNVNHSLKTIKVLKVLFPDKTFYDIIIHKHTIIKNIDEIDIVDLLGME